MNRREIEDAIARVARDPSGIAARPYLKTLRDALAEPWLDHGLAARVGDALRAAGVEARWEAAPLRVGETWLLLCDPATRRGEALRWRSTARASASPFTSESDDALGRAWRGLLTTLAGMHRAAPADFCQGGFDVPGVTHLARIDGASLGVSACLAWLSRALGVAVPAHVAASATVRSDGRLTVVGLLAEKLAALRASAPMVTQVIVAPDQPLGGSLPEGVELVVCDTLSDAIARCGFDCEGLPLRSIEDLSSRVAVFRAENSRQHGTDRWRALSNEAFAVAEVLSQDPNESSSAAQARAWSALFALHAGDDVAAREIVASVGAPDDPAMRVWKAVVEAATHIDAERFDAALSRVEQALAVAPPLSRDHQWIEGHARGTRGRALLHAGRHAEALAALHEAKRWFEERAMPWEAARTAKDVATCLRLQGRIEEALAIVDAGLDQLAQCALQRAVSSKTRDYLRLERGRCLLAAGRPLDAIEDFEHVVSVQTADRDYPRLGALRGLALAHRRAGRVEEADDLRARCRAVAMDAQTASALGRAAAMVVAEALAEGADADGGEQAWGRHFVEGLDREVAATWLARQIY